MLKAYIERAEQTIPLIPVTVDSFSNWLSKQSAFIQRWLPHSGFTGKAGEVRMIPNADGDLTMVVFGVADATDFWQMGALPTLLPRGGYALSEHGAYTFETVRALASLAWGLGSYQFQTFMKKPELEAKLSIETTEAWQSIRTMVEAMGWVRDLINTPTSHLRPLDFAEIIQRTLQPMGAECQVTVGEDLLKSNYPAIHAVGKGGGQPPCLVDVRWGNPNHPKVTLVGKGVCFDSGGLDIKPAASMREMKKDMGGAAIVLGLTRLIIENKLPVRLRVLIPAVENAIDAQSYRPGDVIVMRSGLSVEIDNTDAEGRLVLADALAEASTEQPDLLIDVATLTGAARVALGPEIIPFFTAQDQLAKDLVAASERVYEPLWRMPLHKSYERYLKSDIADMANAAKVPYGGALTAALFLKRFVSEGINWLHFDVYASNPEAMPGRPVGGEAQVLRTIWEYLSHHYRQS